VPEGFVGHRRGFDARAEWVIDLFAKLERRQLRGRHQHA
jgi:hypothetical protein